MLMEMKNSIHTFTQQTSITIFLIPFLIFPNFFRSFVFAKNRQLIAM